MAGKDKYELTNGESIIFKSSCVRHGFWGAYTNELVLTNLALISVELGIFGNHKKTIRYPLSDITQVIQGQAGNGEHQLEVYVNGKKEDFALQNGNMNELKIWVMAINDRFSPNNSAYDYSFYQSILDGADSDSEAFDDEYALAEKKRREEEEMKGDLDIKDVATSLLKSGGSPLKLNRELKKAAKKKSGDSEFTAGIKEELGIYDIEDGFTEIGNEFREMFGLKPKMTHEEERQIKRRAEARRREELARKKREAYDRRVAEAQGRQKATHNNGNSKVKNDSNSSDDKTKSASVDDINAQIETLKKLKELLDMGILTQEEFDSKKQKILNG